MTANIRFLGYSIRKRHYYASWIDQKGLGHETVHNHLLDLCENGQYGLSAADRAAFITAYDRLPRGARTGATAAVQGEDPPSWTVGGRTMTDDKRRYTFTFYPGGGISAEEIPPDKVQDMFGIIDQYGVHITSINNDPGNEFLTASIDPRRKTVTSLK